MIRITMIVGCKDHHQSCVVLVLTGLIMTTWNHRAAVSSVIVCDSLSLSLSLSLGAKLEGNQTIIQAPVSGDVDFPAFVRKTQT